MLRPRTSTRVRLLGRCDDYLRFMEHTGASERDWAVLFPLRALRQIQCLGVDLPTSKCVRGFEEEAYISRRKIEDGFRGEF